MKTGLPLSRYTLNPPADDKWRRHGEARRPALQDLEPLAVRLGSLDDRL